MKWTSPLQRLWPFGPSGPGDIAVPPLPRPDPPVCVIGDLHGCADALDRLLEVIAARPCAPRARLVFVGDMIDRGPNSARVLARLRALQRDQAGVHCLAGNHEAMCLAALERPAAMTRWLNHGGDRTLESYGLSPRSAAGETGSAAWHAALRDALRRAWPEGTEDWLRSLPELWREGGLAVVHAAGDPTHPLDDQPDGALLWGHRLSLRRPRADGTWVAHGHWAVPEVTAEAGRIAVDTGVWRGGPLSAVWLGPAGLEVIAVRG